METDFQNGQSTEMTGTQKVIWDIFLEVKKVLDEEQIPYYILGGTLLGAVRHQGFIPWDDDIDIGLKRQDYEYFLSIISDNLPDYLRLNTYQNNSEHHYYFAQIVDIRYKVKREGSLKEREENVWIDVFPLDGMPDNFILRGIHKVRLMYTRVRYHVANFDHVNLKRPDRPLSERIIIAVVKRFHIGSSPDYRKYLDRLDRLLKKYPLESSRWIVNFMGQYGFKEMFLQEHYGKGKQYLFEGTLVSGPEDADFILKQMYGDYRKLPADTYRNVHAVISENNEEGKP